jgi:predicted RNA-binding Zn ribbon-like protein
MTDRDEHRGRIKGGGIQTAQCYLFELSGGELCLDFANTLDSRPTDEPRDLLDSYEALLRWSLQAKALDDPWLARLRELATRRQRQAMAVLGRARALREAIFEVFAASSRGLETPHRALHVLDGSLKEALRHRRLVAADASYRWAWEDEEALERMLWPVAVSAAELLTSDRLDRVRVCAARDCDWLFLDQSRNRSRRWCDMTVCGNRAKVRRFRRGRGGVRPT